MSQTQHNANNNNSTNPATNDEANTQPLEGQVGLDNTDLYKQDPDDHTPEDIQREFKIPADAHISILDYNDDDIEALLAPVWADGPDRITQLTTAAWSGDVPTELLQQLCNHLTPEVSEVKIAINDDGWFISVVDSANVCMFRTWLDAAEFKQYNVKTPGVIAVNIEDLAETLSHTRGECVTVSTKDSETLLIDDGSTVTIPLLPLESIRDTPEIPDNTINQTLTLPGDELRTVFERVHEFADNVVIRSDGDRNAVTFEADSDECEVVKQYSDAGDLVTGSGAAVFDVDVSASVNSLFDCGYLHNLLHGVKQARLPEMCTVRFGDEFPLYIRCEFGSCSDTHIMFMLAPRVQPR